MSKMDGGKILFAFRVLYITDTRRNGGLPFEDRREKRTGLILRDGVAMS